MKYWLKEVTPMESYGEYTVRGIKYRYAEISKLVEWYHGYLIGYLACDGGYIRNKSWPFMSVSSTDLPIVTGLRNIFVPNATIYNIGIKSSFKVNAVHEVYEVRFVKMNELFKRCGIFCKKIDRTIVGVPRALLLPYIAGALDADGFISSTHRKDCRSPRLRFFITHCSERYLVRLQNILNEEFNLGTTLRVHGPNVYRLSGQHTGKNREFLALLQPYIQNRKKLNVLTSHYAPQESGELLETHKGNQQPSMEYTP